MPTAMITGHDCGMITEIERPERPGAIHRGRLVHLARDRHEVLAHQEDVVGVGEERWQQQRQPGDGRFGEPITPSLRHTT